MKWSADGRRLTFNVMGVGWHVWDVELNRLLNDPKQWNVYWFDLAPDGKSALVAPTLSAECRLRDLDSGKETARLPRLPHEYLACPAWSVDGKVLAVTFYGGYELWRSDLRTRLRLLQDAFGAAKQLVFSRDGTFVAALQGDCLNIWETATGRLSGIVLLGPQNNGLTLTPTGHYTGNATVASSIVMVVQKDDGTQEMLEPADFEKKYGFKNDPAKVRLLGK